MKRFLLLTLLLPLMVQAGNGPYLRAYGVATTIDFHLYNADGTLDVDEVDGGAEVTMSCDEAAETGTGIGTFTDEGTFYSIALDAAAASCARIVIIVAPTGPTETFTVETFGHPDAGIVSFEPVITSGTTQAGSATTTTTRLADAETIADDLLNGYFLQIVAGTGGSPKQKVCITDYALTNDIATHTALHTAVDATSKYIITNEPCAVLTIDNAGRVLANSDQIENSDATDQINAAADTALTDYDAATGTEIAAVPTTAEIWNVICEDQGTPVTCRELLSILLAEAAGTAVYTSGTRTWVVKDPSGTETRLTIVYGAELDGDRDTSTLAPMTP